MAGFLVGRLLLESSLDLSNGLLFGTTFRIDDTEESAGGMRHFLGLADDAAFQVPQAMICDPD